MRDIVIFAVLKSARSQRKKTQSWEVLLARQKKTGTMCLQSTKSKRTRRLVCRRSKGRRRGKVTKGPRSNAGGDAVVLLSTSTHTVVMERVHMRALESRGELVSGVAMCVAHEHCAQLILFIRAFTRGCFIYSIYSTC